MSLNNLIPGDLDVKTFGSWVSYSLERNATSWISFNLATLYYRIVGNAREALECSRRALHFSPREHRAIALVDMGNILTHTHHQEDAILVLHAAVDHKPGDPIAHYTLANSYALIGDLNRYKTKFIFLVNKFFSNKKLFPYRSVLCYENVLKLKPDLKMAVRKMHGIQCLSKLEKALETQHSVLQNTLTELKDQQRKFEEWNQLQEKIVNAQANVGQRLRSQLEYQEFRFRSTKIPPRTHYSFS
jgi:tetratricopeptide (TPR) repeat protein